MALTGGSVGGMHARISEAFAIPYLASRLARPFGILPQEWDPEAIALDNYRRYGASIQAAKVSPLVGFLRSYAARPEIIELDQGLPDPSDVQLQSTPGFRQTVQGQLEQRVPHGSVTRILADWELRKDTDELRPFLLRVGAHFGLNG